MFKDYHGFTLPEAYDEIKAEVECVYETVGAALEAIITNN